MERNSCIAALPNRNGIPSLENAAFEIKVPNWRTILIITTEFYPRDEVLEWAGKLAGQDKYKDSTVIFMTHSYLLEGATAERIGKEHYKIHPGNSGTPDMGKTDPTLKEY